MISKEELTRAQQRAIEYYDKSQIVLTSEEKRNIEVADFGLGELEMIGLAVVVYVNTQRYCAKEIVMFSRQTCPEHKHPTVNGIPGNSTLLNRIHFTGSRVGIRVRFYQSSPLPVQTRRIFLPIKTFSDLQKYSNKLFIEKINLLISNPTK